MISKATTPIAYNIVFLFVFSIAFASLFLKKCTAFPRKFCADAKIHYVLYHIFRQISICPLYWLSSLARCCHPICQVDNLFIMFFCIQYCLIRSSTVPFYAAQHQIGSVNHLSVPHLNCRFIMTSSSVLTDFNLIIIFVKRLMIVFIFGC